MEGQMAKTRRVLAMILTIAGALGCDGGGGDDAGVTTDGGTDAAVTDAGPPPTIPLDPDAPWPKFRANPEQTGRTSVDPVDDGTSMPWVFPTGKGIFSTPVIDADGNLYVGSADRTFYSLDASGAERWSFVTGEIIDSSALLDDMGRVYFGSGDGHLYARDRATGAEVWTFAADDPSVNDAFINWFEGNVAMGPDGTLYAPNDNFCTYAVNRETGEQVWCWRTSDQTWSLPAVNAATGQLFIGNNFLLGDNIFALGAGNGRARWRAMAGGTVAASPMLTGPSGDDLAVVGAFDGYLRALRQSDGMEMWTFGARDHVYASPGQLSDGTIIQPAADGTIYALSPADGSVVWSFDTLEPVRSSPAIDANDQIYVGSGEGRLFVLNPDGTLRFAMRMTGDWQRGDGTTVTMDAQRSDLNSSPALGPTGVVLAGENGGIYFVPYDYCLRAFDEPDDRCTLGPDEVLPDDGAFLYFTDRFGGPRETAPATIEANEPLTFSLFVRESGDTALARIDSESVVVTVTPEVAVATTVSGDRTFLTVVPEAPWGDAAGSPVTVRVQGDYLENLDREGLRFTGGTVGGSFDASFTFDVA
ncbi:MAG: PQQ-like beta-propeller repeat protein, partial [Myxococcales bacterium]|nr:PQQ-like beta-propeller repeat protein [Myxococcales bacterium]